MLNTHTHTLNYTLTKCPQHEFLALHENYAPRWKILYNGLLVNKSPNKKKKKKEKKKTLVSQILDNFDIDEKSLHCYVKDGR